MNQKLSLQPKTPVKNKSSSYSVVEMKEICSPEKVVQFDLLQEITKEKSNFGPFMFYQMSKSQSSQQYESAIQDSETPIDNEQSQQQINSEIFKTVKKYQSQHLSTNIKEFNTQVKQSQKGCNCKHSKCLKNYCDCLKAGNVCSEGCSCIQCQNIKITSSHIKNLELSHQKSSNKNLKGCKCKNSNCLKNYCECHQGNKKCSSQCRCINCKNKDEQLEDKYEDYGRKIIKINSFQDREYQQNKENYMLNQ